MSASFAPKAADSCPGLLSCREHTLLQDCMRRTLLAASDISQSFFAHLDRNIPAVCMVTVVSHPACCKPSFTGKGVQHSTALLQVGALSNAAGAGGGALFVPLFNSLLEFSKSWRRYKQHINLTSALCFTALPLQASRSQQQPPKQSSLVELLQVPLLPCFRRTHSIQTNRSYSMILS